jgi:hypothetical protein
LKGKVGSVLRTGEYAIRGEDGKTYNKHPHQFKSPEEEQKVRDHASNTDTEKLKEFVDKKDIDPKLKKVAEEELKSRDNEDNGGNSENKISEDKVKKLDEEVLPKLKDEPGKLEGKARQAKDKYEKSKKSEGGVIEQYKQNAIRFLQMKQQALDNIEKAKKQSIKLQTVLDTSEAQYDSDKAELEMIKSNLECVVSIPQLQVRESVNRINSIQRELTTRMNEDTIRADVEREIQSEQNIVTNSDLENEFERL